MWAGGEHLMCTPDKQRPDVTVLLERAADGDSDAAAELLPQVYGQLRAAAQQAMAGERPGHTLEATALVHEAYMKLVGERKIPWANRAHFYAAAAEAMRRVLLDHAKARARVKRGGGRSPLSLEIADIEAMAARAEPEHVVAVDDAFRRLEVEAPEAAEVARLRFYAGLTVDQVARVQERSPRSVATTWAFARAWLFDALTSEDGADPDAP